MIKLYQSLELDEVFTKIAHYCGMDSSIAALNNSDIFFNPLIIKRRLAETREAWNILNAGSDVDFSGIRDVRELLQKTLRGQVLTTQELQACISFHFHCMRLRSLFRHFTEINHLQDYADGLLLAEKTYRELETLVDQNGRMKRSASKHLALLFASFESTERDLAQKAKNFMKENATSLQEDASYYRNDRLTFLVKNSDKNKFNGYKYGDSASGQATYVEPALFVELNNQHLSYQEEIEKEMRRILVQASEKIAATADIYLHNYENLEALDLIFAKAKYGYTHQGCIAELCSDGELDLINIAHPLLPQEVVVRNHYRFLPGKYGIIISGSNTGGKTISLKTIGLAVLMTYLGIPLMAEEAFVPLYDHLFVDIQDEQSIASSLSTFSSHLRNLHEIFTQATSHSLILIDELATGTDPREAEALSLAILDRFLQERVHFILTTHYEAIKQYAFEKEEIILSSVGFDQESLLPTYRYHENMSGSSNALAIARKYLMDDELLSNAEAYLLKQKSYTEKLLVRLAEKEKILQDKENIFTQKEDDLSRREEGIEQREIYLKQQEAELELHAKEKLDNYVQQKIEEIDQWMQSFKENQKASSDAAKQLSQRLRKVNTLQNKTSHKTAESVKVGDRVRLIGTERSGILASIEQDRGNVVMGSLTVNTELKKLEKLPPLNAPKTPNRLPIPKKKVAREINVIGQRVEQALAMVDKYLDDAYGAKKTSVKIIHGIGTMALRNAIREHLQKMHTVKSFKDGDFYDGGSAVTIVELQNGTKR